MTYNVFCGTLNPAQSKPTPGGSKYCDECVWLSTAYLENLLVKLQIFCALCLWPWLGSHMAALRYTLCFVDNFMFSRRLIGMPCDASCVFLSGKRMA